jgi:hypothetical protein
MYSTYTYRNLQSSYPKLSSICRVTSSLHALSLRIANLYCSVSWRRVCSAPPSTPCARSSSMMTHTSCSSRSLRSSTRPTSKDKESGTGLETWKLRAVPAHCPATKGGGTENVGDSDGEDDVGSADGRRHRSGWLVKEAAGGLGSSAPASCGYMLGAAGEGLDVLDPGEQGQGRAATGEADRGGAATRGWPAMGRGGERGHAPHDTELTDESPTELATVSSTESSAHSYAESTKV